MPLYRNTAYVFPIRLDLASLLIWAVCAKASNGNCVIREVREVRERTGTSERVIKQVDGLQVRNIHGFEEIDVHDLFGTKNKVLLGILENHVYLYAGGVRHHGTMTYFGEGFRIIKKDSRAIKNGIIMDFPDLTPAEVNRLRDQLRSKADKKVPTLTCVTSAHRELKSALGIHVSGCENILPATLLKNILDGRFVDKSGKPVRVEIYRTNDLALKDVEDEFARRQDHKLGLAVIVGSAITLVHYADDIFGPVERPINSTRSK